MIRRLAIALTAAAGLGATTAHPSPPAAEDPPPAVDLTTPRATFLLGEPLMLYVEVENTGRDAIRAPRMGKPLPEQGVGLFTSLDGKTFLPFEVGVWERGQFDRFDEELSLGKPRTFDLRLVFAGRRP